MSRWQLTDWVKTTIATLVIAAFIVTPVYVVRQQRQEIDRVITEIQNQASVRLEQAILVNTLTISCLLATPQEERNDELLRRCISEGVRQAPQLTDN